MPVNVKRKDDESEEDDSKVIYLLRARWFVLEQTEGDDFTEVELPQWSEQKAREELGMKRVTWQHGDGNTMGYAVVNKKQYAISPLNDDLGTVWHEMAHIVLQHDDMPRSQKEVEAECVAYILRSIYHVEGQSGSRHYIQHYAQSPDIADESLRRVVRAAELIRKAGSLTTTGAKHE